MKKIVINGNKKLNGEIIISGAKNSAVALIPAALLSDEEVIIENIPNISDINSLKDILVYLNAEVTREEHTIKINASHIQNKKIPQEISSKLRASYYFMAALLGKYKYVEMYFPGGCSIGTRPIDQTLKSFESLGATIVHEDDFYKIKADNLIGGLIELNFPSVGATINAIIAATKAKGISIIKNAAREPEIENVIDMLNQMGAKIKGKGTNEITIEGVDYLKSTTIKVIPDRIEAGTYIIAGALMGEKLEIKNVIPKHLDSLLNSLIKMGVSLEVKDNSVLVSSVDSLKPVNIKTEVFPGFPTDLQQPMTVLLAIANGVSTLKETIYENRFQNIEFLNKLGTNIEIKDREIIINGVKNLSGTEVIATDLRAGACLILAGLVAEGETKIMEVKHILRGYDSIIEKLTNVGASIKLIEE